MPFNVITLLSCVFDEIYLFLRDAHYCAFHPFVTQERFVNVIYQSRFATFLYQLHFFLLNIFFTNVHLFRKDLVIEHGINPISLSLRHSLVSLLLLSFLSPFASSPFGPRALSFDPGSLDPPPKPPALPCRFGSPRHRCNVSCPARARTSEKPVSKPGIPRRDRRSLVTWVTLFLSLSLVVGVPKYRRRRRRQWRRAARRRGSRDDVLVVPDVSPMNRSRVATCVRARARA